MQVVATAVRVDADGPRNLGRRESWNVSYRLAGADTHAALAEDRSMAALPSGGRQPRGHSNHQRRREAVAHGWRCRGTYTTNGGIDVDLDGTAWNGGGLDLETTNGGVRMSRSRPVQRAPRNRHREWQRCGIDFPVTVQGTIGQSFSTDLGSGGATLRVRTSNGGVRITKK